MSSQKARTDKKDSAAKRHSASQTRPPQVNAGTQTEAIRLEQAIEDPSAAIPGDLLALQGSHGNRAVSSLIQTKLRVGPAGDSYEQEADRVADRALDRSVEGRVQRQADPEEEEIQTNSLADSITPLAQRAAVEDEEELQAAPTAQSPGEGFQAGNSIEQRLASLRGSGSPLPDELRADMESSFGVDFGGVRVHTDAESDALNRALRAKAFTHRADIYFSAGQYDTESQKGKHLLAHELTHVVQQTGGGTGPSSPAGSVERGQQVAHSTGGEPAVQRNGSGSTPVPEDEDERKKREQAQLAQSQGSPSLRLADKAWVGKGRDVLRGQSSASPPLMLTDRPWSDIEKERSPVRQLLQSEHQSPFPQMPMPEMPSRIQTPPQSPQSKAPLMLTDRPWSEIEGEQRESEGQPPQEPNKWQGAGPKPVPEPKLKIGTREQPEKEGEAPPQTSEPQIGEPKAVPGQEMTGSGADLWAENLMRQHNIDPKDWEVLGKEQRAKLVSDITSGNPKRARQTLDQAKAEREGQAPGAWQTWKAGWGAFFKETIPAKLSALTPTSTRRAQQRAIANRRQALGGQAPGPRPAKTNIGTIEQYLKERKAAKEEQAKKEAPAGTSASGGVSGLDAGIKIGELQAEVKALRTKVEELEKTRV